MAMSHLEHVYWRAGFVEQGPRRRAQPQGDLLTPTEALRVVRMGNEEGMGWLEEMGLIRRFRGRARVVRSELLQAWDEQAEAERVVETCLVGIPDDDDLDL